MNITMSLLLVLLAFAVPLKSQSYHWPLAKEPAFTSSFCEYRVGWRFHAGIDIKTWGRTGYNIHAISDGFVWRIRVAPNGYGKVIYLKLPDGKIAVYAHLESFNDTITAWVQREQEKHGTYRVNTYLTASDIPVHIGDILGKSGRSGIRHPHLHFELRNAQQEPLNPQNYGFNVDDTTPPVPTSLSIRPFGTQSTVNNQYDYKIIPLNIRNEIGEYVVPSPIYVTGSIGIGIANFDRADAASHPMNVYELQLFIDDSLWFATRYDSFSYAENKLIRLDREYLIKANGDGLFQRLYRDTGNTLRHYHHAPGIDGRLRDTDHTPGLHPAKVILKDYLGNSATVRFSLLFGTPPHIISAAKNADNSLDVHYAKGCAAHTTITAAIATSKGSSWKNIASVLLPDSVTNTTLSLPKVAGNIIRLEATDTSGRHSSPYYLPLQLITDTLVGHVVSDELIYHRNFALWNITLTETPIMQPYAYTTTDTTTETLSVSAKSPLTYTVLIPLSTYPTGALPLSFVFNFSPQRIRILSRVISITRITKNTPGSFSMADSNFHLTWRENDVFYDTYLRATTENSGITSESFPTLTPCYILHPKNVPFHKRIKISLKLPNTVKDTAAVGLYARWGSNSWGFLSNRLDRKTGYISAWVKGFATYALRADHISPVIAKILPANNMTTTSNKLNISAKITDKGSGFSDRKIECRINGENVIYEWDAPLRKMTYRPRTPLAPGTYTLLIAVTDNATNRTEVHRTFTIKGQP